MFYNTPLPEEAATTQPTLGPAAPLPATPPEAQRPHTIDTRDSDGISVALKQYIDAQKHPEKYQPQGKEI